MTLTSLKTIFSALDAVQARYLVVGGVAVLAHGYMRPTFDLDLVLDFAADTLKNALGALQALDYKPRIPVDLMDFADPEKRREWRNDKGMEVFNLFSSQLPDVAIDLFVNEPFIFDAEYSASHRYELGPSISVPVVSLSRLIEMKKAVGRPQDQIDVEKLAKIMKDPDA